MDAIYLAVDGQSSGPYTLAQVRESLSKGEISRETSAWYQGLAEWTTVGPILDAVDGAPVPVGAIPPPPIGIASVRSGEFTKDELRAIAKSQNLLMWAVLAGFSSFFIAHIPFLGIPLGLGIVVFEIYALYLLGTALRLSLVWLMCLGMFIPCVSLIILVLVSGRASKILKAAGVRVGVMGGHAEDIKD